MQSRRHVADQYRVQPMLIEHPGEQRQFGLGVHASIIVDKLQTVEVSFSVDRKTKMAKFAISPHMRLQEWVAEEMGYFAQEGLQVETEIVRLATKEESLEHRIGAFESREDEVYRKWRDEYHVLRYRAPTVTPLFQAAFQIAAPNPEMSC